MTTLTSAKDGLTLAQAADHVGVHPNTLRAWMLEGRVAYTRFGERIIRFHPDDLDALKQYTPRKVK